MENKVITIYELLGLIKDGKAPEKIKYDDSIYIFNGNDYYLDKFEEVLLIASCIPYLKDFLNEQVEIIDETDDEFENIEEINFVDEFNDSYYDTCLIKEKDTINQLIRNQKKIIERLKK
jgi:hypothetical protein